MTIPMKQPNVLDMCNSTNNTSNNTSTSRKRIKLAPAPSMPQFLMTPSATGTFTHLRRTRKSQAPTMAHSESTAAHHPPSTEIRDAFPLDEARIIATCLQQPPARTLALPPPRHVRFASCDTIIRIPSTVHCKTTCWYERKDYEAFALDCRQSILAFLCRRREPPPPPPREPHEAAPSPFAVVGATKRNHHNNNNNKNNTVYFTIHGLQDFTSLEAKLLRTQRRIDHIYNVLYHQSILQQLRLYNNNNHNTNTHNDGACSTRVTARLLQQYGDDDDRPEDPSRHTTTTTTTAETILLRQISQLSSLESLRLALSRGQSSVVR